MYIHYDAQARTLRYLSFDELLIMIKGSYRFHTYSVKESLLARPWSWETVLGDKAEPMFGDVLAPYHTLCSKRSGGCGGIPLKGIRKCTSITSHLLEPLGKSSDEVGLRVN